MVKRSKIEEVFQRCLGCELMDRISFMAIILVILALFLLTAGCTQTVPPSSNESSPGTVSVTGTIAVTGSETRTGTPTEAPLNTTTGTPTEIPNTTTGTPVTTSPVGTNPVTTGTPVSTTTPVTTRTQTAAGTTVSSPTVSITTTISPVTSTATLIPPVQKNIVDTLAADGRFTTLVSAIRAANLTGTLSGPGPYTFFAPTDDAFKALPAGSLNMLLEDPEGQLKDILLYQTVPGKLSAADIAKVKSLKTLLGIDLTVDDLNGVITIDEIPVVQEDINVSNGYIQVIDGVLIP
jgi:uncharacterized surface protein with fasciclin (FAS1) repeats